MPCGSNRWNRSEIKLFYLLAFECMALSPYFDTTREVMKEIAIVSAETSGLPLECLPPLSLDLFMRQTGLSVATVFKYRKNGWLRTLNLCGRHFVTRAEIAEFNRRLKVGEFAGKVATPPKPVAVTASDK